MKDQAAVTPLVNSAGEPILIGLKYHVSAPNTSSRDWWAITSIDDGPSGRQVTAKCDRFAYPRTFAIEAVGVMKEVKQIISESIQWLGKIDQADMWVERIDYWPSQKRRGRKPLVAA